MKRAYFVFNKEVGYHSFCSRKCNYKSRMRGRILSCENPKCNKKFYRAPNDILSYNYCSKSCAAIVNNQKCPKWPKRYCVSCKKEFKNRDSRYCSSKCGWLAHRAHHPPKYTGEEIQKAIKQLSEILGRSPSRRELGKMSYVAIRLFGSWNKTIVAAGLQPHRSHDNRMYKRINTKANDGHVCDSISEALIDNWLFQNQIEHERSVKYPSSNHEVDWLIKGKSIFLEYFGLAKDSPRYDRNIRKKVALCKKEKIKLIAIYPQDLYPENKLDQKLKNLLN